MSFSKFLLYHTSGKVGHYCLLSMNHSVSSTNQDRKKKASLSTKFSVTLQKDVTLYTNTEDQIDLVIISMNLAIKNWNPTNQRLNMLLFRQGGTMLLTVSIH